MVVRDQLSRFSAFTLLNTLLKPLPFLSRMGKGPAGWRSTKRHILRSYVLSTIISMQRLGHHVFASALLIITRRVEPNTHCPSAVECICDDGLSIQCSATRQWRWMSHEYIQHDESRKHAEFKEAKPRPVCGQCMRLLPGMHKGLGLISNTGKKVWKEWAENCLKRQWRCSLPGLWQPCLGKTHGRMSLTGCLSI